MARLLGLVICLGLMSDACSANTIHITTWNIHGAEKLPQILETLKSGEPNGSDVFHLQEAPSDGLNSPVETLARELHTNYLDVGFDSILLRYPVLAHGALKINPATGRQSVWVEAQLPDGKKIRFYNLHLSYKVNKSPFIGKIRGEEIKVVLEHAVTFKGPVIVAGDFNSLGWMFFGHDKEPAIKLMKKYGFQDALQDSGGKTNKWVGRIDWIFYRGLKLQSASRGQYDGSDHRWLSAVFAD